MNKLILGFRRLKYSLRHDYFTIDNVVLILAIILCFVWTYQSIMAMSRNWTLAEKLATEKKELELLSVEVEMNEFENEYYNSEEYQELMARKYLDKKLEGENMVVMPNNSKEAKDKHTKVSVEKIDVERSNIEKWIMYLFPNS